ASQTPIDNSGDYDNSLLIITASYQSYNNTIIALWGNRAPIYSIYSLGDGWSTPNWIAENLGVLDNIFPCFNSTDNSTLALWGDFETS
ncbi:hypothetical protein U2063_15385, partial [Listeria monocytogenes]|uniref:hypothetical protein n=1 Tax=Listeria monocytogenes TaxID=1639 RepID=UPI002FDC0CA5